MRVKVFERLKNKIKNKITSKNGNSFLFMPYIVIFGTTLMYMSMEMGMAFVRQVQLQTVTDAAARAGVYGGMTGKGASFYREMEHIYIDLDDTTALGVSAAILDRNLSNIYGLFVTGTPNIPNGGLEIKKINFSNPNSTKDVTKNKKMPVWNRTLDSGYTTLRTGYNAVGGRTSVASGKRDSGEYVWTPISDFDTAAQVMGSGNFFVAIDGEYHTIVAFSVINKDTLNIDGFASALATARLKNNFH